MQPVTSCSQNEYYFRFVGESEDKINEGFDIDRLGNGNYKGSCCL